MKPDKINETDWKLLKEKYPDDLQSVINKINNNYPVQYLIGNVEFYNTLIKVDERVLIPRYETEFLVDKTIQKIKKLKIKNPNILELGTGSGCIAIALKKNIKCSITSVDISKEAIDLALENAHQNKVQINFKCLDMLEMSYDNYDILISNPPYINKKIPVGKETIYEPQNAIFAPQQGLYFYKKIIQKLKTTNQKPTLIAFEIGYEQANIIKELTKKYLLDYHCLIEKDLAGKDRYAFLKKNE